MGLLDTAKAAAELARAKAKETAADLQTKRDLGKTYAELGHKTFELVDRGELSAPALAPIVDRIRTLEAALDTDEGSTPPVATSAGDG